MEIVKGLAYAAAVIVGCAIAFGIFALIAWIFSALISYVFGIDFGFWKGAATLVLLSIVGGYFRGRSSAD